MDLSLDWKISQELSLISPGSKIWCRRSERETLGCSRVILDEVVDPLRDGRGGIYSATQMWPLEPLWLCKCRTSGGLPDVRWQNKHRTSGGSPTSDCNSKPTDECSVISARHRFVGRLALAGHSVSWEAPASGKYQNPTVCSGCGAPDFR